jgi:hypothetical protein
LLPCSPGITRWSGRCDSVFQEIGYDEVEGQ